MPHKRRNDRAACRLGLANLACRLRQALLHHGIAELTVLAHIIIDARHRRRETLIRHADFAFLAAHLVALLIRATDNIFVANDMASLVLTHLPIGTAILPAGILAVTAQLARATDLSDLAACRITARAIIQAPVARHTNIIDAFIIAFAQHAATFDLVKTGIMIAILRLRARDTAAIAFRHAYAIMTDFACFARNTAAISSQTAHIIATDLVRTAHHAAAIARRPTQPFHADLV